MKTILQVFKSLAVAFSMYSKIPMPRFTWESEDMKYHFCFFPWVGGVIGAVEFLWYLLCGKLPNCTILYLMVALAIPLLITGGFHVDGYMDTMDALHSYQEQQKKLEILKDPHIGAFSVICLVLYFLLALGFVSVLDTKEAVLIACMNFFLARSLSGISAMTMPSAKNKGMLKTESETASKRTVLVVLILEAVVCAALMLWVHVFMALLTIIAAALTYLYYGKMSQKQFGGITGDLAGFFVTVEELVVVIVLGIYCLAI